MSRDRLDSVPVCFVRRMPVWLASTLPLCVVAAIVACALFWFGGRMSGEFRAFLIFCIAFVGLAALVSLLALRSAWEYRLAEGSLEFRRPGDRGWAMVELDSLAQVVRVQGLENDWRYELVFCDGRRLLLEPNVFGSFEAFERQLLAVRPGLHFGTRPGSQCWQCGRDLYSGGTWDGLELAFGRRRCDHCGAGFPSRLSRIPGGGLLLPRALDR